MALRILLADDHKIVRESFRALLVNEPGIEVVADVANGESAIQSALEFKPEIVVMDVTMPGMSGMEATRQILAQLPGTKIIALSMHTHPSIVTSMLNVGASAFIPKTCKAAELIEAISRVIKGEIYIAPSLERSLRQTPAPEAPPPHDVPITVLSPREQQLLVLIADGYGTQAIAQTLKITVATVATHRARMMRKLKIENIAALTKYAIREGLASI